MPFFLPVMAYYSMNKRDRRPHLSLVATLTAGRNDEINRMPRSDQSKRHRICFFLDFRNHNRQLVNSENQAHEISCPGFTPRPIEKIGVQLLILPRKPTISL